MCPLVNELKRRPQVQTVVCVTGQHKQMLQQVLDAFSVVPDYDLAIMQPNQTLFDVTTAILTRIQAVLNQEKPDLTLVHGDTSTAFVTALACFYLHISVGHVEAGLRTYNLESPFPEEFNRQAVSLICRYHFAPTEKAKQNLLREGKDESSIFVTGNTSIDALKTTVRADYTHPELTWAKGSRLILITAHRRENLGEAMHHMFRAIRRVLTEHPRCQGALPDSPESSCSAGSGGRTVRAGTSAHYRAAGCAGFPQYHGAQHADSDRFRRYSGGGARSGQACFGHARHDRAPGGRCGGHTQARRHVGRVDLPRVYASAG